MLDLHPFCFFFFSVGYKGGHIWTYSENTNLETLHQSRRAMPPRMSYCAPPTTTTTDSLTSRPSFFFFAAVCSILLITLMYHWTWNHPCYCLFKSFLTLWGRMPVGSIRVAHGRGHWKRRRSRHVTRSRLEEATAACSSRPNSIRKNSKNASYDHLNDFF